VDCQRMRARRLVHYAFSIELAGRASEVSENKCQYQHESNTGTSKEVSRHQILIRNHSSAQTPLPVYVERRPFGKWERNTKSIDIYMKEENILAGT